MRTALTRITLLLFLTAGAFLSIRGPSLRGLSGDVDAVVAIAQAADAPATYEEVRALVAEAVESALGPGGFANLVHPGDTVFIKLNANELAVPAGLPPRGYLTDPRVARAVAELVTEIVPAAQVKVGEGISHFDTDDLVDFQWGGYDDDLDGELDGVPGVKLVCLNEPHDPVHAKDPEYVTRFDDAPGHQDTTWWIPNVMADADVRICIPVVKAHNETGLTCAMKNSIGVLPADIYYSGTYNRYQEVRVPIHVPAYPAGPPAAIADINAVVPYDFVVVDMLTAHRYGPWSDAPDRIEPHAILAGRDAVAVDTTVASILGWDPTSIDYLVYGQNDGTGICDPGYIEVRGMTVEDLRADLRTRYPGKIPFPLGTGGGINGGSGTTALETSPPAVTILSPEEGASVSGEITVSFECSDNVDVARAELLVDGNLVNAISYPADRANLVWSNSPAMAGEHTLTVRVFDRAFNEATDGVGVIVRASFGALTCY